MSAFLCLGKSDAIWSQMEAVIQGRILVIIGMFIFHP